MRLSCQKVFLLLLVSTIGCRDPTALPPLPAQFALENINGRQLPTHSSPAPDFGPTILSASLTLDNAGRAVMTEHRRESDGTETTVTLNLTYRVDDNQIEIGTFQPCDDTVNCVGTFEGTISGDTLSLTIVQVSINGAIIYNYRLAAQMA